MKPQAFQYVRVQSPDEAIHWLQREPEAKLIAGGQSLVPLMNFRLSRPAWLIDINPLEPELGRIAVSGSVLQLGAMVRHQRLITAPEVRAHCPVLAQAASYIGHWAIRTRGTLGGSVAHADPAAELPAALVALGAEIRVQSPEGQRAVPAREFFLGYYTTALNPDEMIVEVHIPLSEGPWGFAEIARRSGDFALAGAFLHRHHNLADVTWFGVGASPIRVQGVSVASDVTQRVAAWRDALLQEMAQPVDTVRVQQAAWVAEQAYQQTLQGGLSQ